MIINVEFTTSEDMTISFELEKELQVELTCDDMAFDFDFGMDYVDPQLDFYDEAYEVTPKAASEQKLATRYKMMKDDVTVKEVPYYETSNEDGETVYIASEVN